MKNLTSIGLLLGILILVNLLSRQFFLRLDLTQNKQYTLSHATKNILGDLDEPILVKAFFTSDLPQQYQKTIQDFHNLLVEYANRSHSMVDFEFIDPGENEDNERKAMENGISPLLINVREKNKSVQKKAFMGAVVEAGDLKDVIAFVQPEGPMEYQLTTAIKKVSRVDKPAVALLQGHGEPSIQDLNQAVQTLSILYQVESVDMRSVSEIASRYKTAILIKPADTIPPAHLAMIDDYLAKGGNLLLASDRVEGNFQTVQGTATSVGLEDWLGRKGVEILPQFLVDANCGSVSVQQQQGFFRYNTAIEFPFFPLVKKFGNHPITKGIEQVVFQFVSPINYVGDTASRFTPLVVTSGRTGTLQPPLYFDVQRKWSGTDFPLKSLTIGGLLEQLNGSTIALFSDGDFALGAQNRSHTPDNISLLVNAIDFLSDDTGLIDLRTKGVTSRPIEEMDETKTSMVKWVNFLLPIALVLLYGFIRFQRNRNQRIRRMEERYA